MREALAGITTAGAQGHAGGLTTPAQLYATSGSLAVSARIATRPSRSSTASIAAPHRFILFDMGGELAPLPRHLQILCFERRVLIARGHVFALRGPGAVALRLRCHRKSAPCSCSRNATESCPAPAPGVIV